MVMWVSLGEVHHVPAGVMHLHRLLYPGVARLLAPLKHARLRVVLLVDDVVARADSDQVRVVGGRRDGDGARAARVGVTELVGQLLQLVSFEPEERNSCL